MPAHEVINLFDLTGKVALVTGAGRGLGRAFAGALAGAGADVVCSGRNTENITETAQLIGKYGHKTLAVQADVSNEEDVKRMVGETVQTLGRLDILINNAGVSGTPGPVHQQTLKDWNDVIAVDLNGVFLCCKEAAVIMMGQKSGKIINIASIQGIVGATPHLSPPFPAYAAAKGGVINLTRELALEYAPFGINVNCIAPAPFETEIVGPLMNDPQFRELVKSTFPLRGGIGKPEDLNGTIIFLASKASDYVSGHILVVDQGFLAS